MTKAIRRIKATIASKKKRHIPAVSLRTKCISVGVIVAVAVFAVGMTDAFRLPPSHAAPTTAPVSTPKDKIAVSTAPVSEDKPVKKEKAEPASASKPASASTAQTAPAPAPVAASQPQPKSAPASTSGSGIIKTGFITGYTIHDNDPPGSKAIAYSSEWEPRAIHTEASGTGTYDNPITLAAQAGDYAPGTRFYLPHVDRYFILEDTCASCGEKSEWIDMWIAGELSDSAAATDACARKLTGTFSFEVNPPHGRYVVPGPLFNSATDTCYNPTP